MAKIGRPTKYNKEMLPKILELMRKGASQVEVAAMLEINADTLFQWKKDIPEFSDTMRQGIRLSQAWWERQGREGVWNKYLGDNLNGAVWYMNMKNRFGWCDKQEIKQETTHKFKDEEIKEMSEEELAENLKVALDSE